MISAVRSASRVARCHERSISTAILSTTSRAGKFSALVPSFNFDASKPNCTLASKSYHNSAKLSANIYYDTEESSAFIGKPAPLFTAPAVIDGEVQTIKLDDYKGKWTVLLFYPKDFTFVCPTEIIAFSDKHDKFKALNAQVIALSTDTEECHLAWTHVPRKKGGLGHMNIPLVADTTKSISADYGVLIQELGIALRGLFIINPEGILQQIVINNLPVGRSVEETLRLIEAYQFVAKHGEVCPANWKPGSKTMKADAEGSLEYFASGATEHDEDDPMEPSERVIVIKTPQDYKDVVKESKAVVDFVAPYCGKCRQIMPYVNQLSEEYPDITFAKFDTTEDALIDLSVDLGVQALPAFHFFHEGKPFGDPVTGYKKKSLKAGVDALMAAEK